MLLKAVTPVPVPCCRLAWHSVASQLPVMLWLPWCSQLLCWEISKKTRPRWRTCACPRIWRTLLEVSVVMCPQNSLFPTFPLQLPSCSTQGSPSVALLVGIRGVRRAHGTQTPTEQVVSTIRQPHCYPLTLTCKGWPHNCSQSCGTKDSKLELQHFFS